MKIYLMRHSQALDPQVNIKRPLSEEGRSNATRVANFLKKSQLSIAQIYHSGQLRAEQTAEIIEKAIAPNLSLQILSALASPDGVEQIREEIASWTEDTFIVGHIPLLPRLLGQLVVNNENALLANFQPAMVVCLESINHLQFIINWILTPEILPKNV